METKKADTHITVVIDKSGSMNSIKGDTIGGFNQFLADQKALPGEATLTLVLFDTGYEVVTSGRLLPDIEPLTPSTYRPGGGTALLDALGRSINETGAMLAQLPEPERPEKIVFAILTDGEENSSREFSREKVFEMIRHQTEVYKWQFIFLGANQDAIAEAGKIGIPAANALNYAASNVKASSDILGRAVGSYRKSGDAGSISFTEDERSLAAREKPLTGSLTGTSTGGSK